jgi:hypothetical protein
MTTTSRSTLPQSNAGSVAHQLAAQAADGDGTGLVEVLKLLLGRAEEIRTINQSNGEPSPSALVGDLVPEPAPSSTLLLGDVYKPLCLKLFLACAFTALAEQLKSQLKQRDFLRQVKQIVFSEEGDIASYSLHEPEKSPD